MINYNNVPVKYKIRFYLYQVQKHTDIVLKCIISNPIEICMVTVQTINKSKLRYEKLIENIVDAICNKNVFKVKVK